MCFDLRLSGTTDSTYSNHLGIHISDNQLAYIHITADMAEQSQTKDTSGTTRNPFGDLIQQNIAIIPSFTLESGATLKDVPVAYKTWGQLNARADNVLVICHALTGSADVEDWYVSQAPVSSTLWG
jgi:hypothetical protein